MILFLEDYQEEVCCYVIIRYNAWTMTVQITGNKKSSLQLNDTSSFDPFGVKCIDWNNHSSQSRLTINIFLALSLGLGEDDSNVTHSLVLHSGNFQPFI